MATEPFEAIAQFIASHDNFSALSNDQKLDFYALYKTTNGVAPDLSFSRRLYLYIFEHAEYHKWMRWYLWSRQESEETARVRYSNLAKDIGAYPSDAELQIMQNASRRGKGASVMVADCIHPSSSDLDELIGACQDNNVQKIQEYLVAGGNVNVSNEEDTSLLHFAVDANALEISRLLLSHGADAHAVDDEGLTPLKSAELNGDEYTEMVALLQGAARRLP